MLAEDASAGFVQFHSWLASRRKDGSEARIALGVSPAGGTSPTESLLTSRRLVRLQRHRLLPVVAKGPRANSFSGEPSWRLLSLLSLALLPTAQLSMGRGTHCERLETHA